jgi:hypothetical protein
MSSMNGLSSNTSNNNPARNFMNLDASTRESIQSQSEARILSGLMGSRKDSFNNSGGMNPLKGLYSAAAASFLKNKQDRQGTGMTEQKKGGYESSVAAVKKLSTEDSSSTESWQNTKSNVSGPASGGDYKKFAWTAKPGVTGSDTVQTTTTEPAAQETTIGDVFDALSKVIQDNGGEVSDKGGGTSTYAVLDLAGEINIDGDTLRGTVKGEGGTFTFTLNKDGEAGIDASEGDTTSAEFEQLTAMLNGSLEGVRRRETATPPPAMTPEEQAAADAEAAAKAAAAKAAADAAAAAAAASNTGPYQNSSALLTALTKEISGLGGTVSNKNGDAISHTSVKGMSGTIEQRADELRVNLSFGTGTLEVRLNLNGEMTTFKTNGITLFKGDEIGAIKNAFGKLKRTGVNMVA